MREDVVKKINSYINVEMSCHDLASMGTAPTRTQSNMPIAHNSEQSQQLYDFAVSVSLLHDHTQNWAKIIL